MEALRGNRTRLGWTTVFSAGLFTIASLAVAGCDSYPPGAAGAEAYKRIPQPVGLSGELVRVFLSIDVGEDFGTPPAE